MWSTSEWSRPIPSTCHSSTPAAAPTSISLGGCVATLVDDDRDSLELGRERGIVVEDRVLELALGLGAEVFEPGLDVPLLDEVQDVGHVSSGLLGTGDSLLRSGSHIVYL